MNFSRRVGARFNRGRIDDSLAASAAFSPSDIPGLVLWLDNSLVTESGGLVTAWPDLSGAGNHFAQANPANQPSYIASETDFPTPQAAVKFDVVSSRLVGPAIANVAWMAIVAVYPATTFSNYSGLLTAQSTPGTEPAASFPFRGESGANVWRTTTGPAGTRYRDGVTTNTPFTTANAPHLYEFVPSSPWTSPAAILLGGDTSSSGRQWTDSIALVLMATAVPDSVARASLTAYCQGRGMIP